MGAAAMLLGTLTRVPFPRLLTSWGTIVCLRHAHTVAMTGTFGSFTPGEAITIRRSGSVIGTGSLAQVVSLTTLIADLPAVAANGDVIHGDVSGATGTIYAIATGIVDIGPALRTVSNSGLTSHADPWGHASRGIGDRSAGAACYIHNQTDFNFATGLCIDFWVYVAANVSGSQTFLKLGPHNASLPYGLLAINPGPVIAFNIRPTGYSSPYFVTSPVLAPGRWHHGCAVVPTVVPGSLALAVNGDWASGGGILPTTVGWGTPSDLAVGRYTTEHLLYSASAPLSEVRISRTPPTPVGIPFTPPDGPCGWLL